MRILAGNGKTSQKRNLFIAVSWSFGLVLALLVLAFPKATVHAADKIVTNCTDAGLRAALVGGGDIRFNCGGAATIKITGGELVISEDTIIWGEGLITLDGNNASRIIRVAYQVNLTIYRLTLQNAVVNGGASNHDGGSAIKGDQGNLAVYHSIFLNNSYTAPGSGGYDWGGTIFWLGGTTAIYYTTFDNNKSYKSGGAAIHTLASTLGVYSSNFSNNVSTYPGHGGAIYNDNVNGDNGYVQIRLSSFSNNSAQDEAGAIRTNLYNGGQYAIYDGNYFVNNKVTKGPNGSAHGGALRIGDGTFTISNSIFDSNLAETQGGAIWTGETVNLKIFNVEISNNIARTINSDGTQTGFGGGIALAGNANSQIEISNATINNNIAGFIGGGIVHGTSGPLYLENVTLTDNYAWWEGGGLGNGSSNTSIRNSIIAYNRTDRGGNNWAGKRNCNVFNHTNAGNNLQYSAVTDDNCAAGITLADPKLAVIADNGGANGKTRKPLPGSPAINAGNIQACAFTGVANIDQRKLPRSKDTCDIGAFEIVAGPSIELTFSADTISLDQTVRATYGIRNPYLGYTTNIGFTHNLPSGLQVAPDPDVTSRCSGLGTISAVPGSNSISVSGFTSDGYCDISVVLKPTAPGTITTATGGVTTKETEQGSPSNQASLTVKALGPSLKLSFGQPVIAAGSNVALQFALSNPNAISLSGISFTQTLPSQLKVVSANASACGGTVTATAGSSQISFSGGTLAANASCNFSVQITSQQVGAWSVTGVSATSTQSVSGPGSLPISLQVAVPGYSAVPVSADNKFYVGAAKVNATRQATLTVKNSGHPVTSLTLALVNQPGAPFSVSTPPATLAGGASANITVSCTPTTTGTFSATLSLTTNSGGQAGTVFNHTLICAGGYVVTKPVDDGSQGTLSYILTNQATQPGDAVVFELTSGNTVTFSSPLALTVRPGVTLDGGCSGAAGITLNGTGQASGLQLSGDNYLSGLLIRNFAAQQIQSVGKKNRLFCTTVRQS